MAVSDKAVKLWVETTSEAMVGLCVLTKEQLTNRFKKINANQNGMEIIGDMSLPNAIGVIHELENNADIILGNAYEIAGQTPSLPSAPQNLS